MNITLPAATQQKGNYVSVVQTGNFLFVSGHTSSQEGYALYGKVGRDVTAEQAYEAARQVAISILGTVRDALGSLDRVHRVIKVFGMVNSAEDFTAQAQVINGASDFFVEVFGEPGRHARSAVGMAQLPRNTAVEIEAILEVE